MSHQMEITNGIPKITDISLRTVWPVAALISGGKGIATNITRVRIDPAARKPANTRIAVRAHGRRRNRPREVQNPMQANTTKINAPATTNGALLGGWG